MTMTTITIITTTTTTIIMIQVNKTCNIMDLTKEAMEASKVMDKAYTKEAMEASKAMDKVYTKEYRVETKDSRAGTKETKGSNPHIKEYRAETKEYKAGTKGSKPTTTPGGNGAMGQGPTPGGAIGGGFGGGSQGISNVNPLQHIGAGVGQLPPPINLQTRPSGGFKVRPDSSNQYAILMPASPTITTLSGEGGLVDDTSVPAQGTVTVAPLPLDYRHSITSSNDSWDDRSQDLGYSPHNTQTVLNQSRYYDATSSQHNSGRVFPSPNIATIPVAHSSEVRSPQDSSHEVKFDSIVSNGNVSSLNTFDRRHPQSHEGSEGSGSLFAVSSSASSRNPQDRFSRS
ncbi:hypothetical protein BGZ80_004697 [Entomortierella chlamydospora]|uniref:Uncharacterized protein n=1 Tax=Entomortierella chlamydospora TaxID=101097 RepID=A0A9P6T2D4_9FUNG|nr:hypothetical protein BGZ80_004697 [Entomortierella chlamydospora]